MLIDSLQSIHAWGFIVMFCYAIMCTLLYDCCICDSDSAERSTVYKRVKYQAGDVVDPFQLLESHIQIRSLE